MMGLGWRVGGVWGWVQCVLCHVRVQGLISPEGLNLALPRHVQSERQMKERF